MVHCKEAHFEKCYFHERRNFQFSTTKFWKVDQETHLVFYVCEGSFLRLLLQSDGIRTLPKLNYFAQRYSAIFRLSLKYWILSPDSTNHQEEQLNSREFRKGAEGSSQGTLWTLLASCFRDPHNHRQPTRQTSVSRERDLAYFAYKPTWSCSIQALPLTECSLFEVGGSSCMIGFLVSGQCAPGWML